MPDYLPADELKRRLHNISDDVLKRSAAPVARLPDPQRQPNERSEGEDKRLEESEKGVRYRVVIISIRRRLCDEHDNLRTGAKPLVDRITERLGFASDNDTRLEWCYHQIIGRPLGTVVMIERQ